MEQSIWKDVRLQLLTLALVAGGLSIAEHDGNPPMISVDVVLPSVVRIASDVTEAIE